MTTDLSDLYRAQDPSTPTVPKGLRPWLLIGLGACFIVGAFAWTYIGRGDTGPPLETTPAVTPVAVDETPEQLVDPRPEPALAPDEAPSTEGVSLIQTSTEPSASDLPADDPTKADDEAPTDGKYYVQVAAYKNEADADAEAQALSEFGVEARTVPPFNASLWHKVRLGPFDTRAQAETARFKLDVSRRRVAYVLPRSNGKFHVQVGSFATREKAEPVAKRLAALGHSTKISRIRMAGQRWHCVRVGPFDTYEEAAGYQKLLPEIPGSESRVIPFRPIEKK